MKMLLFRMNSFVKELCDDKNYTKSAKKLEFEVEEEMLEKFARFMKKNKKKSKPGLSFEVGIFSVFIIMLTLGEY